MANLSSLKGNNEFVSQKSAEIREYTATVMGFLLVAGYFYYDSYLGIKIFIGALILIGIAVIISF